MNNKRSYVLQAFMETPWAILPNKLETLKEIVDRHVSGEKLTAEEVEARVHGAARPPERRVNKVAVLPLFGTIFPRANLMTEMSGATSAELFGKQFDELLKNPEIDAIVLDVNSPGGQVGGIPEVAEKIYQSRGQKKIIAVANHLMASAAFWMGTAADELVVSPSSDVGSIGVFSTHWDYSKAYEDAGWKPTLINAGKYKTVGNPYEPLSEEARAVIQKRVDEIYDQFVAAVAKHRGVKEATVRNGFGEGSVVGAEEAVKLGMADRVGTLDETVNGLLGRGELGSGQKNQLAESGQAPASENIHTQEARARLASVGNLTIEGDVPMYLRELLNKRETLLARANELVANADKENRDLTEDERKEFNEIMGVGVDGGQIDALDAKITQIQDEREKLRKAAEVKFNISSKDVEKPDAQNGNKMKMADFRSLDPAAQMAFIKGGGKLED